MIDGTDPGWGMRSNETINIGNVDSRGTAITGVQFGHPDVNGISGMPVDSSGSPLSSPFDLNCIGAFYPFFSADGGNVNRRHYNSAIAIFLYTFSPWRISVSARLVTSSPNVTVNQLKWKMDQTSAKGFQGYRDFSTIENIVASGLGTWQYFYIDYGLLVEYEDGPGSNTWLITYTLITD